MKLIIQAALLVVLTLSTIGNFTYPTPYTAFGTAGMLLLWPLFNLALSIALCTTTTVSIRHDGFTAGPTALLAISVLSILGWLCYFAIWLIAGSLAPRGALI